MATVSSEEKYKAPSTLGNFAVFMKRLLKNRRGALGFAIILIFVIPAVAAPLVTPYDPVYQRNLSSPFSAPSWYSLFTSQVIPTSYPLHNTPLSSWQVQSSLPLLSASYSQNRQAIEFNYQRTAGTLNATVSSTAGSGFNYGFNQAPQRFLVNSSFLIDVSNTVSNITIGLRLLLQRADEQPYEIWNATLTREQCLLGPWCLRVGIYQISGATTSSTPRLVAEPQFFTPGKLFTAQLDSESAEEKTRFSALNYTANSPGLTFPSAVVFTKPGPYKFSIQETVRDNSPIAQSQQVTIFYTSPVLSLVGNGWGVLGTDQWGRDIFSQLVYGARISLFVGLVAAFLAVIVGLIAGLMAGYIGGVVDEAVMRFTDMLLVLPTLPLLLVLVAVLGASIWNIILIVGLLGWMGFARVVRSQVVSLRERPFIESAKASGGGTFHIIGRHIIPNVLSLAYVTLALSVPNAIVAEASLSFLGLGDPTVVSWGEMLNDVERFSGFSLLWWVVPPGLCIALISLSFILIGYSMDEILNPRLRARR